MNDDTGASRPRRAGPLRAATTAILARMALLAAARGSGGSQAAAPGTATGQLTAQKLVALGTCRRTRWDHLSVHAGYRAGRLEGQRRGRRSWARAVTFMAMRDRLCLAALAERRFSSSSASRSSASASRNSFTNIGCMVSSSARPVDHCCLAVAAVPGRAVLLSGARCVRRKYELDAETVERPGTHRICLKLCGLSAHLEPAVLQREHVVR
jgi:hypothetical protein